MLIFQIRHETLRIAIIGRLEEYLGIAADGSILPAATPAADSDLYDDQDPSMMDLDTAGSFEPFKDLCKRRFMWYYDSYLVSIEIEKKKVAEGQRFATMPFEHSGNTMEGKFLYSELSRRIEFVRKRLDAETKGWATEGLVMIQKESGVAANLQRQYEQTVEYYKKSDSVTLDIELVDKNPFVWRVVGATTLVLNSRADHDRRTLAAR